MFHARQQSTRNLDAVGPVQPDFAHRHSLKGANEDQNHDITIALRAMEAPLREIVTNCGEEPSVVLNNQSVGAVASGILPNATLAHPCASASAAIRDIEKPRFGGAFS